MRVYSTIFLSICLVFNHFLERKTGYTQSHIEEHTKLKQQVFELQERMKGGDFMVGIELISFLKDWLNHHILEIDMAYSEFLISKGVK